MSNIIINCNTHAHLYFFYVYVTWIILFISSLQIIMPVRVLLIGDSNTRRIRFAPTVPEQRLLALDGMAFIKVDGFNDTVFSCAGLPGLPGGLVRHGQTSAALMV